MYCRRTRYLTCALLSVLATNIAVAQPSQGHGVFVMTNDADRNEVIAYERGSNGLLGEGHAYSTEGRGSGGTVDPLASQGSLTLSTDQNWLFATNAGSGTVSALAVDGARLSLSETATTEGAEPVSVAQYGHWVYVLNAGGASSVVGFWFDWGRLRRIPNSLRYLSGTAVGPGSLAFSPDGKWLAVTEKATQSIDIFGVLADGTLSAIVVNKKVGPGTFSARFAPNGTLVVAETGVAGATNGSAISTYQIQPDGTLQVISASIPTLAAATCWDAVVGGKLVYTSNAGTANLSGFSLSSGGALTALPGTIAGSNPAGSTNIDVAASSDGAFLYTLNTGTGKIGVFAVNPSSGTLSNIGEQGAVPVKAGANGIAAN